MKLSSKEPPQVGNWSSIVLNHQTKSPPISNLPSSSWILSDGQRAPIATSAKSRCWGSARNLMKENIRNRQSKFSKRLGQNWKNRLRKMKNRKLAKTVQIWRHLRMMSWHLSKLWTWTLLGQYQNMKASKKIKAISKCDPRKRVLSLLICDESSRPSLVLKMKRTY